TLRGDAVTCSQPLRLHVLSTLGSKVVADAMIDAPGQLPPPQLDPDARGVVRTALTYDGLLVADGARYVGARDLRVTITSERHGGDVTLTVRTTDRDGLPVATSVGI